MSKNILVINSSPRANGNTEILCDAFIEGAQESGHQANKINLRELKIGVCLGCYKCFAKKGEPCVQKDDMDKIYTSLNEADTVVFASPVYWWQFNAQMKTVIDRLLAVYATAENMQIPKRDCLMLIAGEDKRQENFSQIISYYKYCMIDNMKWQDKGMVLAGGVNKKGEVTETPFVAEARNLGKSL
ncbi:MAG: flavodoxin family protein [Peptococcaceae bacterium]|nr:flavodoxin family protein [Peptococcaceae bacterium]